MATPLDVTAGVIAVVTLAYNSSKSIYEFIRGLKDAPKEFDNLKIDLGALQKTLDTLKAEIEENNRTGVLSEDQLAVLRLLELPLRGCSDICDGFRLKLTKLLSHSNDDHISFRDRMNLLFQSKEVSTFRFRLASFKSTLNVAVSFASFKTASQNVEASKALEIELMKTTSLLSGQIQGIEAGVQSIITSGVQTQGLVQRLEQQAGLLAECLKVCMTTWSGIKQTTGTTVHFANALNDSKYVIGNVGNVPTGGPSITVDTLVTQNRAQAIVGNVEGKVALEYFNLPASHSSKETAD
ncbi:hypothetical protein AbraCBS73388_008950 [Aspergillus brasiliensis]|uniref:Azaphilone pigments biosynthesis cluster protein L N-terminal domain-containing protein n=1 Tax=Aspergillus brasiliensis TaxID=319629 RepID=A0A9W5Z283_9EURO|nr:hypothetical protein AbraCBS73388_008950 [Aspergillus brasiliensis]